MPCATRGGRRREPWVARRNSDAFCEQPLPTAVRGHYDWALRLANLRRKTQGRGCSSAPRSTVDALRYCSPSNFAGKAAPVTGPIHTETTTVPEVRPPFRTLNNNLI